MKKKNIKERMTSASISKKAIQKIKEMAEKNSLTQTECLERIVEDAVCVQGKRARMMERLQIEDMSMDEKLTLLIRRVEGLEKGQNFIKGVLKVQEDKLIGPILRFSASTDRVVRDILDAIRLFN